MSRTLGTVAQLRSTLDLVWFERSAREEHRAGAACAAAESLGITNARLAKLCGAALESTSVDREATVAQASAMFERQLLLDPDHYRFRVQLARRKLQLARFAGEKGDRPRAMDLLRETRALVEDLVNRDRENPHLQQLLRRIERANLRFGAP